MLSVQTGETVSDPFQVLKCNFDDEFQVGKITKQWTGLASEMFTDADNFGINFPLDLDVKVCLPFFSTSLLISPILGEGNSSWSFIPD